MHVSIVFKTLLRKWLVFFGLVNHGEHEMFRFALSILTWPPIYNRLFLNSFPTYDCHPNVKYRSITFPFDGLY